MKSRAKNTAFGKKGERLASKLLPGIVFDECYTAKCDAKWRDWIVEVKTSSLRKRSDGKWVFKFNTKPSQKALADFFLFICWVDNEEMTRSFFIPSFVITGIQFFIYPGGNKWNDYEIKAGVVSV